MNFDEKELTEEELDNVGAYPYVDSTEFAKEHPELYRETQIRNLDERELTEEELDNIGAYPYTDEHSGKVR